MRVIYTPVSRNIIKLSKRGYLNYSDRGKCDKLGVKGCVIVRVYE